MFCFRMADDCENSLRKMLMHNLLQRLLGQIINNLYLLRYPFRLI